MRITHYFHRMVLEGGGPVRGVIDLATALARAGHELAIVTTDDRDVPAEWARAAPGDSVPGAGRPRVVRIGRAGLAGAIFGPRGLRAVRRALAGSDVVHLHGVWTAANVQVAGVCRSLRVPYVWSIRGTLDDWCMAQGAIKKRAYLALVGRRALEGAACCHLTAEEEHRQAKKWFPGGRGLVIPNLLDLTPFRDLPGPDEARARFACLRAGRPVLLFLSRLHYKKGVETLVEAGAMLRANGIDAAIAIAGSGDPAYERSLRETIERRGMQDRAELLGFVGGRLKVSLYQASDLFVLPTSQENFGFVIYEALACGTPVVTTFGVDTWEELKGSGGVEVVRPDAAETARAVEDLLGDARRRRAMGESGRSWALGYFDESRLVGEFASMYARAARGEERA